jgi:hypothetical protein
MKKQMTLALILAAALNTAVWASTQTFDDGSTLTVSKNETTGVTTVSSTEAPAGALMVDVYGKNAGKNNAYTIKVQTFDDGDTLTTTTNTVTGEVTTSSTQAPKGMMMSDASGFRWSAKRAESAQ